MAFSGLLRTAREILDASGTVEEVLWALWSGTSWPEHLRTRTQRGGSTARLANRDLDAMCALFETAARAEEQVGHKSVGEFLATLGAAGDPRRHPGGAWHPRRVGAPADRAPVQGPGVAAGRGRARAGDLLARPAPPDEPAAGRPHRRGAVRRPGPPAGDQHEGAARRGAPPVLRRLHACVRAAGRHGRRLSGRRGRAAFPVPHRARRGGAAPAGSAAPAAVPARAGQRAASYGVGPRGPTRRSATPPCDGSPAWPPSVAPTDDPWSRQRTRRPGGGPAT